MNINEKKLREKGWTEEEIKQTKGIIERAPKHPKTIKYEKATFIILLAIMIIGTIIASWFLIPITIVMTETGAIIMATIFGAILGITTGIMIKDVEHLEKHHHTITGLAVPITATIMGLIISQQGEETKISIIMTGMSFTIGCLITYYTIIKTKKRK